MEKLMIKGGRPLYGRVPVSGAKNSAVALIPATVLADSVAVIGNMPEIRDVQVFAEILHQLGAKVSRGVNSLRIDARRLQNRPMADESVKKLRASYYLMGAMLGRFGEAVIGLPGGCHLGSRPMDQHIKGFEALGARVVHKEGLVHLSASRLKGARIYLDVVSVGATINIMLAASRAEGVTTIENAAKEPEIIDVATLLTAMGAKIQGAGTGVIRIRGMHSLRGCHHSIIPDRIEAGTYLIAGAATGGEVTVENVIPLHLEPLTAKLREMGIPVEELDESVRVMGRALYKAVDIKTLPYPGFPTDLQQPFVSLLTGAKGISMVTDNIHFSRFKQVDELCRMGADIRVEGRTALVQGRTHLHGAPVRATDIRGGAALVVAALAAEGVTGITGIEQIERGYEDMEGKLRSLGAEVWRA